MSLFSSSVASASAAAGAFDQLHARHADALVRQVFLLCGRQGQARRAVGRAFRLAWERWPEVAADPDPAGWVRAAAHDYALSPWLRWARGGTRSRARRAARAFPGPPQDRALLEALLRLPPSYRRALVLHDAVGLTVTRTAEETEASLAATKGRIGRAREAVAGWVPRLADSRPEEQGAVLHELLVGLTAARIAPNETSPAQVRAASERATRRRTWLTVGLLALVVAVIGAAAL
jgi:DNA-directed RNA polymerase specialized sigma24 family protein